MAQDISAGPRVWVDATAGLAGDMLLGALLDAGASLDVVSSAVQAVCPEVSLILSETRRNGMRAARVQVSQTQASPARHPDQIVVTLAGSSLPARVKQSAAATVERLAAAEAQVHGVDVEKVHLHEVGAWDSIADIVGCCAALDDLGASDVIVSDIALGSGRIQAEHGDLPVPAPAVVHLLTGWQVRAGGEGELTTPTGAALVRTVGTGQGPIPSGRILRVGIGAGSRDTPGRANVVRVVLLRDVLNPHLSDSSHGFAEGLNDEHLVELSATVDDLDPRIWPTVVATMLSHGARDTWLVPALMKKGRPGQVIHVLTDPTHEVHLSELLLTETTTLGVRRVSVHRTSLDRAWVDVLVDDVAVAVKLAVRGGRVLRAVPEFESVLAAAQALGRPVAQVMTAAQASAVERRVEPGTVVPQDARDHA